MKIVVQSPIAVSPRVLQVRGMFNLPEEKTARVEWDICLPLHERPWNIGLIVGPSGCGKSTIARHLWLGRAEEKEWPRDQCILDGFPGHLSITEVTAILSSVGFASPPAWLRPFHVLSNGQQFRVRMARLIAEASSFAPRENDLSRSERRQPIVVDEFTSVLDRTVAKIGSAAVARAVRKRNLQFVAVTCHEDVGPWLGPDWIYRPAENHFTWRLLRPRPGIELEVCRCEQAAWRLFAPHHYLSGALARNAVCFLARWRREPVAFSAWIPFFGSGPPTRREHRTVTLPDYQGVGIGNALAALVASMWQTFGYRALCSTSHPAMIAFRKTSPLWHMHRPPSFANRGDRLRPTQHALTRLTAGFTYVGPALHPRYANALLG